VKAASQTQPNASTANRISKKADAIKGAVAANVDLDDELTQMCRAAVEDKDDTEGLLDAFEALPPELLKQAVDALRSQGSDAFKRKDYEGAISLYSQALTGALKDEKLYCNLAACLLALHRPDRALVAALHAVACSVTLAHTSPDGDEGYPGEVQATITFSLNPMGVLRIEYGAEVKGKPSPVDMGHTLFWNLAGQASGPEAANQHAICLAANKFIVMNEEKIPTGEQQEVQGQAVDLKETKTLETALKANGDDCFEAQLVLDQIRAPGLEDAELHFAASLQDVSGRYMEVHTSAPVLNFQTSFSTGSLSGKGGAAYVPNGGICLRTQGFPDAVNQPEFPSMTVAAGETYSHVVEYRFFCGQFY